MNTRFAGDFGSDPRAEDARSGSGIANIPLLDSLGIAEAVDATQEAEPEAPLIRLLRVRRLRAGVQRAPRSARRPETQAAHAGVGESSAILAASPFLRLLQLEERRADRSHAPLSLMLFRLDVRERQKAAREAFARCLRQRKRETDYLGRLADDVFVVLLPETDADGTRRFDERLRRAARGIDYSSRSATYPEDRLEPMLEWNDPIQLATATAPEDDARAGREPGYALKRTLDVVGAIAILLLAAPVMLVTAVAILLSSPGPVIFRQVRLGKGGVPFDFYKFRSMRTDVDDDIHRRYVEDLIKGRPVVEDARADGGLAFKMNRDPRITTVGRWIRRTSIDELPQLWNVIKGDMSLVGPRPPIPYEADNYQSWHLRRVLEVKPGITGLWQVLGRSRVSFDDMVRMDIQYAQNCSLSLDLRILARTAWVVLRCEGAG